MSLAVPNRRHQGEAWCSVAIFAVAGDGQGAVSVHGQPGGRQQQPGADAGRRRQLVVRWRQVSLARHDVPNWSPSEGRESAAAACQPKSAPCCHRRGATWPAGQRRCAAVEVRARNNAALACHLLHTAPAAAAADCRPVRPAECFKYDAGLRCWVQQQLISVLEAITFCSIQWH